MRLYRLTLLFPDSSRADFHLAPRNDGAIDFSIVFGEADPPQCSPVNGSLTHGQSSDFAHKPATTGFCRM